MLNKLAHTRVVYEALAGACYPRGAARRAQLKAPERVSIRRLLMNQ